MKVLSIGSFKKQSNTCLHRHWALNKLATSIDRVELYRDELSYTYKIRNRLFQKHHLPISLPDENKANWTIQNLVKKNYYDLVWIDKGLTIGASTLKYIKHKNPGAVLVSYSPDNMAERHNQSLNFLKSVPFYDHHITTKSYIVGDLKKIGAKNVFFTNQSFEPSFHHPINLKEKEKETLGGDVGFVGNWEKERCKSILHLVDNGVNVKVYGDGKWQQYKKYSPNLTIKPGVYSEDYSKILQAFKISLCFLRKINSDLQTSRTMEIPACGGFMMAERTSEHLRLFEEDQEAVFFSSDEELLKKCTYYLKNEHTRIQIAKRGHLRCHESGYSNLDTIKRIVSKLR